MVYVEYEGVPLAARGINTNTNENNENNDEAMTMVSEDFKAMRHFKVKRPNDRQKNWKKRKRSRGKETTLGTSPLATRTEIFSGIRRRSIRVFESV